MNTAQDYESIFAMMYTELAEAEDASGHLTLRQQQKHQKKVRKAYGVEVISQDSNGWTSLWINDYRMHLQTRNYLTKSQSELTLPTKGDRSRSHHVIRSICVFNAMPIAELTIHALYDELAALILSIRAQTDDIKKLSGILTQSVTEKDNRT